MAAFQLIVSYKERDSYRKSDYVLVAIVQKNKIVKEKFKLV